jgi:Zn-dependent protease with chaperone function
VAAFAAFLLGTHWVDLVVGENALNASVTVVGDDVLLILPFLLASAGQWVANYSATRELGPASWSLGECLGQQLRFTLVILAPWLVMTAAIDSEPYWPAMVRHYLGQHKLVAGGLSVAILGALLLVFPIYLIRLWPARRLPDGPLRLRLESLLARAGVGCRELMVWRTGGGRVSNAAVMGIVGRFRYVAFTDALLGEMTEEEIEAVLAHEIGHARHGHLWFYVLFTLSFAPAAMVVVGTVLAVIAPVLQPGKTDLSDGRALSTVAALLVAVLVAIYWRYVFGFLSRGFEREADVAACELVGTPLPLMTALEKLALVSGSGRAAPSWRHYSVAERVDFAARYGFDREALAGYHRRLRAVKAAVALVAALLIGGLLYLCAPADQQEPAAAAKAAPSAGRR